ncbi:MAG TPA: A24 family peptidase [Candidatus Nitrosopolaris sp.]|nr:A24 family peptidase [Candidatus Nitrosopolaris sp.]
MAPGVFTTVALLLYVGLAVLWDVRQRRIPNWLSGTWLLLALPSAAVDEGIGLRAAFAGLGLGAAALLGPYLVGAVGAADLKFAAVSGAWLGPRLALNALLLGMAMGLVVALAAAASMGRAGPAVRASARLLWLIGATGSTAHLTPGAVSSEPLAPIPYAVPLGLGVVTAVLLAPHGWLLV